MDNIPASALWPAVVLIGVIALVLIVLLIVWVLRVRREANQRLKDFKKYGRLGARLRDAIENMEKPH